MQGRRSYWFEDYVWWLVLLIQAPTAPFLGAVQIPFIHLLKLAVSSAAPLSQLPTFFDQIGGLLVSPDGPFRHAAAFTIEEGQYSEPLLFKKKGVILHTPSRTLGVQAG